MTRTVNFANINKTFPLLASVFRETLRARSTRSSIRCVRQDSLFADHYLLKKSSMLQMPLLVIHESTSLWGKTAKEYNPRCLIEASGSQKKATQVNANQAHLGAWWRHDPMSRPPLCCSWDYLYTRDASDEARYLAGGSRRLGKT